MRQLKIAAPLKERDPCVPSARVERVSGFIILTPQRKPFKNFPPKRVKLCKNTWGPVAPSQPSVMKPGINRPPATSFYSRTPVVVSNLIVSQIFGSSGSGIPSLYPPLRTAPSPPLNWRLHSNPGHQMNRWSIRFAWPPIVTAGAEC